MNTTRDVMQATLKLWIDGTDVTEVLESLINAIFDKGDESSESLREIYHKIADNLSYTDTKGL